MTPLEAKVRRLPVTLSPDPRRVLLRPFIPALVVKPMTAPEPSQRVLNLFARVMMLDDETVARQLELVMGEFDKRHVNIRDIFRERFAQVRPMLPTDRPLSEERQLLLGSYFTNEYSLEAAALFNPSIVPHPDQTGAPQGALRFVLSLRATGEGHISSITFRSGLITADAEVRLDPVSRFVRQPRPSADAHYYRDLFLRKLYELGLDPGHARDALGDLPSNFSGSDLAMRVRKLRAGSMDRDVLLAADRAMALAQANYNVEYPEDADISEKIIFPFAPSESNGIEDARFVRFAEDDGEVSYFATYTAYDGSMVLPQLLETRDFRRFSICTLNGPAVRNKGLALFPRRIGGRYAMLGRQDSENIHLMFSDHPHFWHESKVIVRPAEPWEFVQLGNCGSPIETEAGWLVLTHGVGPMRKYSIGAVLLDHDDPSRVIGRLREPLLGPAPDEREGYVPNVVYSCGALVHAGHLVLPYAVSDTASRFAVVPLADLLEAMRAD